MRHSMKVSPPRTSLSRLDAVALLLWCIGALWATLTTLSAAARIVAGTLPGLG